MQVRELIWALGAHEGRTPVQIGLEGGRTGEIAGVVVLSVPNRGQKALVLVLEPPKETE